MISEFSIIFVINLFVYKMIVLTRLQQCRNTICRQQQHIIGLLTKQQQLHGL